jgi:hypothetical protein
MLNFLEAGSIVKKAAKKRAKASKDETKDGEKMPMDVAMTTSAEKKELTLPKRVFPPLLPFVFMNVLQPIEPVPDVEWWDKFLLPSESYVDVEKDKFNSNEISALVGSFFPFSFLFFSLMF